MRVAIFHDYIDAIGGAEKLVLALARELDADVITTDVNHDSIKKLGFEDVQIISIGTLLESAPFKQIQASIMFSSCRFPEYDFYIFSGNWAQYAAARHKPNMWYCHTPVRAFYDLRDYTLKRQKTEIHRIIARLWIRSHGYFDKRSLRHICRIVTNSENSRRRIARYYGKDAPVIYPPIPTKKFRFNDNGSYWLSVNRLYPEKRIMLQLAAFERMPEEKLKIAGWHSKEGSAKRSLGLPSKIPENVEFLKSVSDEELVELYANCKGLLCTAIDEDFGMTPLEAMASGKPVVSVKEGGYLESMVDGVTGRLVDPTAESIIDAVRSISKEGSARYKDACMQRAKLFDEKIFFTKVKEEIRNIILMYSSR